MGKPSPADWKRLWLELDRVRLAKRLSWAAFSRQAGVSRGPIAGMKEGVAIKRDDKLASLERAAGWELGTIAQILRGGAPNLMTDEPNNNHEDTSMAALTAKIDWLVDGVTKLILGLDRVSEALERLAQLTPASGVPIQNQAGPPQDPTPQSPLRPT
jgi:transcriptional regulator with XRE-family HTH domain